MNSRLPKLAGLAWCFALLILPGTLYLFGKRTDNIENRTLVTYPRRTIANVFKISTYRTSADALIDRLPLRDSAIALKSRALLEIGDNPNPTSLVVGDDGWLFITDEVLCDALATTTAQFVAQSEIARSAALAAGKQFVFAIVPTKMIVEDRHFGAHHPWEDCARGRQAELRRAVAGKPGFVDLWTPLDAITSSGRDVFWRIDSHLRPRGKLAYVRALEAAVEPERARTVDIGLGPPRQYLGDLALFTLYKQFDTTRPIVTRTTPQTPPPASKPIVVLGDSQTETIQGEIAAGAISSFGFCSWDSSFFVGGCDEVFRGAGTIAVETVARAVWRRTEWGFGSRILGALLPIIPSKPAPWTHVVGAANRPDHVSTLTVPHASFHLPAVRDNVDRLRAIRFTIDATAAGGAPVVQLLIDGKPSTEPLTSIANAPSHVELTLLVPRGTPISRTEVTVDSAPGAAVSPARISTLG